MSEASSRAADLKAAGHNDQAVALARRAADEGDADCLTLLAIWHMAGSLLPRDLPAARDLLRQAAQAGDAWAARTHAALLASGIGGTPDWQGAIDHLRKAAAGDNDIREHMALLDAMELTATGDPVRAPRPEFLGDRPRIALFRAFLTPDECRHIATVATALMEPSTIVDPATRQIRPHPIRTSSGATLGPTQETLPVQAIQRRIAAASGVALANGESISVLHYAPGQQYRMHVDTLPEPCNQRIATMIMFLNDGYGGGETMFEASGMKVSGRGGDAILFANVLPNGRPDPASRHAGLPVTQGAKWVATRWLRAGPYDPWNPI